MFFSRQRLQVVYGYTKVHYLSFVIEKSSRLNFLLTRSPRTVLVTSGKCSPLLRRYLIHDPYTAFYRPIFVASCCVQHKAFCTSLVIQSPSDKAKQQNIFSSVEKAAAPKPHVVVTKCQQNNNTFTGGVGDSEGKSTFMVKQGANIAGPSSAKGLNTMDSVHTRSPERRLGEEDGVRKSKSSHLWPCPTINPGTRCDVNVEAPLATPMDSGGDKKELLPLENKPIPSSDTAETSNSSADVPVKRVVFKVLALLWPKGNPRTKLLVVMSMMCVLVAKVLKVAVPFWFKSVIDILTPNASAATALPTIGILPMGVFGCVAAYGICRAMNSVTEELKTVFFAPVGGKASTQLAIEMFDNLLKLDLSFHLNRETGVLSKDLDRGSRAFWSLAYALLFLVVPTAFEMVLVCAALNSHAGTQFIGLALTAVFSYILWTYIVSNWRTQFRRRYNELESRVGGITVDALLNYEAIKCFRTEEYESARIRSNTEKMNTELIKLDQSLAFLNFGQQLIFVVAGVLSFYLATCGAIAGNMTVGDLVLTDALLMQLYMPLSILGMIYREIQTSTQNMQSMIGLLDQSPSVLDAIDAKPYMYINGTIELRNLTFKHKADSEEALIRNLSLKIPGGKIVAFVGPSGSGKSTIIRLIFRFFDPTDGEILFDGQPLRNLQLASVRSRVGIVPQDPILFNISIRDNISYSQINATDSDIIEVAKKVGLHETIQKMSKGYSSSVGERGLKLSGGEKQRVAIARALLMDPPILLADEATSALDSKSETKIMEIIKLASKQSTPRTIILIAHRLTTVKDADIIFVLDGKGGLAEQGAHSELLQAGGLYADLWYQQLRDRQSFQRCSAIH
ncbi:unnamed protein product [Phytomonas sp. Hart1]|nr:unnamed protein product [Phytomonas sp. Hart1]|eukprot:CCW68398.1 unnamed protein product [Phytomonas sp. isolate Hart1]